jgi:hypothetical protein
MPRSCSVCSHPGRASIDDGLVTGQSLRAISAAYGVSKSAVDRHKESHLPVLSDQERTDLEREVQAARQADHWHYNELRTNARAVMRAMQGWRGIRSAEDWQQVCENAHRTYASGAFIIKRLGAERFLDPETIAVLLRLHQDLIAQYGQASPAATMLIDLALMTYHNALRIQTWIGDLALAIEHELFAEDSLKIKLRQQYGPQFDGFAVEEALRRLREQLLPLCERVNRQLLQNLQALQRLARGVIPTVAINRAANVSIAERQLNIQQSVSHSSPPVEAR